MEVNRTTANYATVSVQCAECSALRMENTWKNDEKCIRIVTRIININSTRMNGRKVKKQESVICATYQQEKIKNRNVRHTGCKRFVRFFVVGTGPYPRTNIEKSRNTQKRFAASDKNRKLISEKHHSKQSITNSNTLNR